MNSDSVYFSSTILISFNIFIYHLFFYPAPSSQFKPVWRELLQRAVLGAAAPGPRPRPAPVPVLRPVPRARGHRPQVRGGGGGGVRGARTPRARARPRRVPGQDPAQPQAEDEEQIQRG